MLQFKLFLGFGIIVFVGGVGFAPTNERKMSSKSEIAVYLLACVHWE